MRKVEMSADSRETIPTVGAFGFYELQNLQNREAIPRVTREQIITEARSWIGTPYQHLARAKGVGVDCSQFVIAVATALGYVEPDFNIPVHAPRPHPRIFEELTRHLDEIPIGEAKPGDILIFCFNLRTRAPQHMAFVTDLGLCHVHPHTDIARVVEHRLDDYFRERIVSAWRFRGVED